MSTGAKIERSIVECNKIIHVFMEDDPLQKELLLVKHIEHFGNLDYNTSWESLMLVVEKIESLGYIFTISQNYCNIQEDKNNVSITGVKYAPSKIEVVCIAVIEFIQWYNNQKQ